MAENLQVGHTQQEIYLRQLREQQEKQLDEITKKVQSLEEISSKELYHRRELCARIIEYEQGQVCTRLLNFASCFHVNYIHTMSHFEIHASYGWYNSSILFGSDSAICMATL